METSSDTPEPDEDRWRVCQKTVWQIDHAPAWRIEQYEADSVWYVFCDGEQYFKSPSLSSAKLFVEAFLRDPGGDDFTSPEFRRRALRRV